jgi:hypothetical protein
MLLCSRQVERARAFFARSYFKPTFDNQEARTWGPEEKQKLIQGIKTYGIGNWESMKSNLLPRWVTRLFWRHFLLIFACRFVVGAHSTTIVEFLFIVVNHICFVCRDDND